MSCLLKNVRVSYSLKKKIMKKVILAFTAISFLLISCSKEINNETYTNPTKKSDDNWTQFEDYSEAPTTLSSFLEVVLPIYDSIENNNLNSMTLNEAVWKLEATLNHVFRHRPYGNQEHEVVSYSFDLSTNESELYEGSDLQNAFISVHNDIIEDGRDFLVSNFSVSSFNESNGDVTLDVDVYYYNNAAIIGENTLPVTASSRKAVTPEDCNGNFAMAAIDKIPSLAFNKASNTRNYNAAIYYSFSNVRSYSSYYLPNGFLINSDCLPGGANAVYSQHQNGVNGNACFTSAHLSGYRDQVLSDINLVHGNSQDFIIQIEWLFNFSLNGSGYGILEYDLVNVAKSWGSGQSYQPQLL